MNDADVVRALVEIAPPVLDRYYIPARCVASTREGLEVLRYFGVEAKPLKMMFVAGNERWREWVENGRPGGEMPESAWAVGIDTESVEPGRYAGHLVIVSGDLIVDLALGQFARPERNIVVPEAAAFEVEDWQATPFVYWRDGTTVTYTPMPQRDWRFSRAPLAAGEIIRTMKEVL